MWRDLLTTRSPSPILASPEHRKKHRQTTSPATKNSQPTARNPSGPFFQVALKAFCCGRHPVTTCHQDACNNTRSCKPFLALEKPTTLQPQRFASILAYAWAQVCAGRLLMSRCLCWGTDCGGFCPTLNPYTLEFGPAMRKEVSRAASSRGILGMGLVV